ncbi:hypothetical protein ACQ4PT_028298 [Festuca glaucescens]
MAHEPRYHGWQEDPPDYGDDPTMFTTVLEHNGFFCGLGDNLTYISGTLGYFDNCNTDTFSLLWIEDFLRHFDYHFDGKLHVYWLKPGKELINGLQCIEYDRDIVDMIRAAEVEKQLVLIVDHTNFLRALRDDVLHTGGPQLPYVISPTKIPTNVTADQGEASISVLTVPCATTTDEGELLQFVDSGSYNDTTFDDSDYDIEDGDDDLFADNVDKEVNDSNPLENEFELENEQALEDTNLNLREEDEQWLQNKFKVFNPEVDMDNPIFRAGLIFSSVKELRKALIAYSVRNRVKVNKLKNDKRRLDAVCKPGCPWFLKATADSTSGGFKIRGYQGKHTCQGSFDVNALTAPFLAEKFIDEIRDNQKISLQTFAAKVQREYNMCPNRWKLSRARKDALNVIHGDEDSQFML